MTLQPSKPSTPAEISVIIWTIVAILLAIGGALVFLSIGQPPEKESLALKARYLGGASLAMGAMMAATIIILRAKIDSR